MRLNLIATNKILQKLFKIILLNYQMYIGFKMYQSKAEQIMTNIVPVLEIMVSFITIHTIIKTYYNINISIKVQVSEKLDRTT